MGADHHVAVRRDVQSGWLHFVLTDPDLSSADQSSSSAGVVFLQVTYESLPASTYAHHHVTLIQHLHRWQETVKKRNRVYVLVMLLTRCLWNFNHMKTFADDSPLPSLYTYTHNSCVWAALDMKGKWSLQISLNQMKQHLVAPAEHTHTHTTNPHIKMHTHTCSDTQRHTHTDLQWKSPPNKHYVQ